MKKIEMIQTYDSVIHPSVREAKKHLEKQYGDILLPLTHRICDLMFKSGPAVMKVSEYIDAHLDEFEKLRVIKEDMSLFEDMDLLDKEAIIQ
jgi:hypothetical protein